MSKDKFNITKLKELTKLITDNSYIVGTKSLDDTLNTLKFITHYLMKETNYGK